MPEYKRQICSFLCDAIQLTKKFQNLIMLKYEKTADHEEYVTAIFEGEEGRRLCVTLESGWQMIKSIVDWLDPEGEIWDE